MAEPNLINRVRLAREGSAVERCHAHPHLMRYSVGHHSNWLVADHKSWFGRLVLPPSVLSVWTTARAQSHYIFSWSQLKEVSGL